MTADRDSPEGTTTLRHPKAMSIFLREHPPPISMVIVGAMIVCLSLAGLRMPRILAASQNKSSFPMADNPTPAAVASPNACLQDANGNGRVDAVERLSLLNHIGGDVYLPLILDYWHQPWPTVTPTPTPTTPPPAGLIQPDNLHYLGAFRLPADPEGMGWEWANWSSALTYYPQGDPTGPSDGFPGSLFGTGHDWNQYVSEINIPVPVISPGKNVAHLHTATTLQPFADIRGGLFGTMEMPRVGLAHLPAHGSQTTGKLYFAWQDHAPGQPEDADPSHGWAELDLAHPQSKGLWRVGGQSKYVTGDYLFAIPQTWADAHTNGRSLATGRFRDGGQAAEGPALFAVAPWAAGNPPTAGTTLPATPLLLYQDVTQPHPHAVDDYQHSDEWTGGAWLTAGNKTAVIFVGTKGTGANWYGCADGTDTPPWPDDCDRGWWSSSFQAEILFYDPADLAAVAAQTIPAWQPQPYAVMNLDPVLYHITSTQQKYHVAAAAFDRAHGLLYILEPLADEDRPLVHVWKIQ